MTNPSSNFIFKRVKRVLCVAACALVLSLCSGSLWAEELQSTWQAYAHEGTFVGKDDVEIAYIKVVHPNAKGTVLLSAGRTESYLKYKELIAELFDRGYSVYSADHRGQGLSGRLLDDPLKGHVVQFGDYVEDLQTFLDSVVKPDVLEHQQQSDGQKLYLLAHSMGGAVGILLLADNPGVFESAIMSAPMLEANLGIPGGCAIAALVSVICSECSTPRSQYKNMDEAFANNKVTHSRLRYQASQQLFIDRPEMALSAPTYGWVNQACKVRTALMDAAAKISTPVLVLHGELDTVVLTSAQDRFCKLLNSRRLPACVKAEPLVIKGAFHELFFELDKPRDTAITAMFDMLEHAN